MLALGVLCAGRIAEDGGNVEEKQREYEREIRNYKKAAVITENPKQAANFRKAAKKLNEEYRSFSVKNKVAWNPDRVKIFNNED